MKFSRLAKYALGITTGAAILAACSNNGGSSLSPSGTSSGMAGITHIGRAVVVNGVPIIAAHPNLNAHRVVRFAPANGKGNGTYQYVTSLYSDLLEYDYPKGDAPIGSIDVVAGGECTRNGRGTFWVAGGEVEEFKVGGTSPIRVLKPSGGTCAIDPATGDLASPLLNSGGVIIFRHARGKGKVYGGGGLVEAFFDGYDDHGNLFLDGFNNTGAVAVAELPKGSSTFETVTLSNTVGFPGSVQWDGKYLTIEDQLASAIYGYTCSGTSCTFKRAVSLTGAADCAGTWIAKSIVFCADAGNDDVEVYKYPAGGSAIATLTGADFPLAVVQVTK